jgi:hypothetical protein
MEAGEITSMISDDSDATSDANLQSRQNTLADIITTQNLLISIKLFGPAQEASAGGLDIKRKTDLFNAFEKRSLVFNYLGTW